MNKISLFALAVSLFPLFSQSTNYVCSIEQGGLLDSLEVNGTTIFQASSDCIKIGKQYIDGGNVYQIAYYNDSTVNDDNNEHLSSFCVIIDCSSKAIVSKFLIQSKVISLDCKTIYCVKAWTADFNNFILTAEDGTFIPITYSAKTGFFPSQLVCPDNFPTQVKTPNLTASFISGENNTYLYTFTLSNPTSDSISAIAIGSLSVDGGPTNLSGEIPALPTGVQPLDDLEDMVQAPSGWEACFDLGSSGKYYLYCQNSSGADCEPSSSAIFTILLPFLLPKGAHFYVCYGDMSAKPGYQGDIVLK